MQSSYPSFNGGDVAQNDVPIIATANDAILSKLSASSMGYYDDPFLPHLCKDAVGLTSSSTNTRAGGERRMRHSRGLDHRNEPPSSRSNYPPRRSGQGQPLIRRGSHARVCCIDRSISAFLSLESECHGRSKKQVVVIGAGKDTAYLRYRSGLLSAPPTKSGNSSAVEEEEGIRWYEVDHGSVIQEKRAIFESVPEIKCVLSSSGTQSKDELTPSVFHMISHDLRHPMEELFSTLIQKHSFNVEVPTLFVLECVQMYLPETNSRDILSTITHTCTTPFIALYDPVLLHDSFGKVMHDHLAKAGTVSKHSAISHNRTLLDQIQKLKQCGFDRVVGCDMMDAYDTVLTKEQRRRANSCEMLDEIEEW
eukprot:CAMPEP_0195524760 /NCGR_PEP_ID=MMETSP0794_2-20130614/24792_1 /TAXON_ID=515487 /ORGANISM="Stephanopyxis turris, Strain CCMP 815" /LENGTH=364 /DNA_ID=CAMNT_0040655049 /DNA_START=100 /DNA_END=1191 /DNA_ORIENTATION=+